MTTTAASDTGTDTGVSPFANPDFTGNKQGPGFYIGLLSSWFAVNLATQMLLLISMPRIMEGFYPGMPKAAQDANSTVIMAGGIAILLATPFLGRLSDRTISRWGMRRPWLVFAALATIAGSVLLLFSSNLAQLIVSYVVIQVGIASAQMVQHTVIADQVPTRIRATLSAGTSVAQAASLIAGTALGALVPDTAVTSTVVAAGVIAGAFNMLLFIGLNDSHVTTTPPRFDLKEALGSYVFNPVRHPDLAWAWLTRFMITLAIVMILTQMRFIITLHLGVPKDQAGGVQLWTSMLYSISGAIFGLIGGVVSDRMGRRKPLVFASCLVATVAFGMLLFTHSTFMLYVSITLIGIALGFFLSVDVALITEVLPSAERAGKDLGVIALAYLLPQFIAPVVASFLVIGRSFDVQFFDGFGWPGAFTAATVFVLIGALAVIPIKKVR